ncbi:AAA family ATPase [Paenibacillus luteus]|uniref:AAA family ATPase n=1 Tax=Paenibacillus luteus TaxID=2545753 RepID=UPI00137544E8|nr:AAA family ATPase [Paenibacillus luteus]
MKLVKAEINGYGQLNARQIPLNAPVVIVYGPNEAGKSTMFGFIRTMLFGFARRGQPLERQEPVNGGKHGGRLFFSNAENELFVLERYASDHAGKLKLRGLGEELGIGEGQTDRATQETNSEADARYAEGTLLLQTDWERLFLGGVTERLYRQLFAITLSELQEVGALSGDELGRYLYQAGWDNGKTIAAAEKRLLQEMESLFKPRGSLQPMNQQLKSLEQLEATLRKREDSIGIYNELTAQTTKLEASIVRMESELPEKAARHRLMSKACSARPLWMRKQKLLVERESVAYAGKISEATERSWSELLRQRAERREEWEKHRQKGMLIELQLEAISYDEELIRLGTETEALLQASDSMRKLEQDRAELASELREHDEMIARLVSSIAPEWTERQLRELQVTVADRDLVRNERQQALELSRSEERIAAELETLSQQELEASLALEEARSAAEREQARREKSGGEGFEVLPGTREALKGAWNALDLALREWELERVRAAGSAGEAAETRQPAGGSGAGMLWAAAAGAGGAALALAVGAGEVSLAVLVLAGAAILLAAAALVRGRSGAASGRELAGQQHGRGQGRGSRSTAANAGNSSAATLESREERVMKALEVIVREPREAAAALLAAKHYRSPEHMLAAEQARVQLRAAVETTLEALLTSERLLDHCSELAQRLDRLRAHAAGRREAAAAAAQTKQAAARQWAGWLAVRSLPADMSPTAVLEAFELAEQALQRLQQYDRLSAKHAAAGSTLAAFAKQAAELCEHFEEAAAQHAADPALALRLLHAEIRRHAAAKQDALGIIARREELHMAKHAADLRLQELDAEIAAQLAAAGLAGEAEYTLALEHRRTLQFIHLELSKAELEIAAGLSEERLRELELLFEGYDEEQLQAMQSSSLTELEELEREKREALEKMGRFRQSMEHLLQEAEQQRLLAEKEMTLAQLESSAERYAVLSVSAALISRTKRIYEEERQPVVLRNASRFIEKLTEGKYIRVLTVPGESGIKLETSDRRLIDSEVLSRGTAEQVYLAMRFALAEEASHGAKLPLMLDDVFVNFDKDRLHAVAKLLEELSCERQIIVMTCHEHVRDALQHHCAEAVLVQL